MAHSVLSGLRAFEAAARHLSFRRAAEELGVTPTAISHAVRGLELHCRATLFRRRTRPLALTHEGETLFPIVRDAFATVGEAVARLRDGATGGSLRVTATNAFAARWLLPRLPRWRLSHPGLRLEVIGTDAVLDLAAGEADVAVRYGRAPPASPHLEGTLLARDTFRVVASPALVGAQLLPLALTALAKLPLIESGWPPSDANAPTWRRWEAEARGRQGKGATLEGRVVLSFAEELYAIEAAVAGQGVAICSDVLVAAELTAGRLMEVCDVRLPGYAFLALFRRSSPRARAARQFVGWLAEQMSS